VRGRATSPVRSKAEPWNEVAGGNVLVVRLLSQRMRPPRTTVWEARSLATPPLLKPRMGDRKLKWPPLLRLQERFFLEVKGHYEKSVSIRVLKHTT